MAFIKEFRAFYIFLVIMAFALCFAYVSRLAPLLLAVLIIAPIISFALLIIGFLSIKVSETPAEIIVEKKQDCSVKIRIKNRFILPVTPVLIRGVFFNETDGTTESRIIIADAKPFAEIAVAMPFSSRFRGEYIIGIESYEIFDLFKLFKLKRKVNENTTVIVLPKRIEANGTHDANETEADSSQGLINHLNKTNFSSFREYRIGDKMQHIHWKLTAKHDDFIVKEMEQTISNNSVIFCDFSSPEENGSPAVADVDYHIMSDAVIEGALALVFKIIKDGNSTVVCWRNPETSDDTCLEITDVNLYHQLFYTFALQTYKPASGSFRDLTDAFSNEINEQRSVYLITNNINLEFIEYLGESGLTLRKDVIIMLFNTTEHDSAHIDYIKNETRITLKLVDAENIAPALSD